jgi:8-oxo-dGTP diphosphatase
MTTTSREVVEAVVEHDGKYLVCQRPQGSNLAGHWEFPGGKIETGETPEEALTRELREELTINVAVGALVSTSEHSFPWYVVNMRAYRCSILSGTIHANEHAAIRWVTLAELNTLELTPGTRAAVSRL